MLANLKALGLALGVVFVMSATMASGASSHTAAEFTIEDAPANITGTQNSYHLWTVTGLIFTCKSVHFHGTASETTNTSLRVTPAYGECSEGSQSVSITGFGTPGEEGKCWWRLDASGSAALECNNGDVTIHRGTCVIHIPAQELGHESAAGYDTEINPSSDKHDLKVFFKFYGLDSIHTDGFLCPLEGGSGAGTTTTEGFTTMTAESEEFGTSLHLTHDPTVP